MKKFILISILLIPFLCQSQNMRVSHKGNLKDIYNLADVQKVTFANVECADGVTEHLVIKTFNLLKNYPNPFSNVTTIELNLGKAANTVIDIYSGQGMLVKELYNSYLSAGEHKINWDGRNNAGSHVVNGLYFYQVRVDNEIYSNKMFLIK